MSPLPETGRTSRFRLFSLLTLVTVVCFVLALPKGNVLFGATLIWVLLGSLLLGVLLLIQAPIYLLMSWAQRRDDREQHTTRES